MSRKPAPPAAAPSNLAVVYTRVSSAEQVDGTSLDTQRDLCERCAARNGLAVLRVLSDEGKSARSTAGRTALAEAIALCERRGAALVVYKFDRLARNVGDAYQMRDVLLAKGCRIISATEGEATASPIAKAMFNMIATFAELDNDMRGERARLGLRARAQAGGWVAHAPFGFKACRTAQGIPALEPGEHADLVRDVLTRIADGSLSVPSAIEALRPWHSRTRIYVLLRNPVYCGIVRNALTDGKPVPAVFPGLVSRDTWDAVQRRLDAALKPRKVYTMNNADFPFTRVIPCPVCGKPLRGGWSKGRGGARYGYYFCSSRGHCSVPRDDVHAQFRALAVRLAGCRELVGFIRDNLRNLDMENDPVEMAAYRNAQAEIATQERRMSRLRSALLDGAFTGEEYAQERAAIEVRLAEARGIVETHAALAARRESAVDALCGLVSNAGEVFDRMAPAKCREFVRIVFGEVRLIDGKRIEPSQDSVFQLLATAQAEKNKNGGTIARIVETLAALYAGLRELATAISA